MIKIRALIKCYSFKAYRIWENKIAKVIFLFFSFLSFKIYPKFLIKYFPFVLYVLRMKDTVSIVK